jgi:Uma2 family endonuclease
MTAEELLETPGLGRCELLHGELIQMTPAGFEHGRVAANIGWMLKEFVRSHPLGVVTGAETGFQIGHDPDTVRAPDAALIRLERVPPKPMLGFFPGAPELAVEVLSPGDREREVVAKVRDWLGAGCQSVWVVDPETMTIAVYRGGDQVQRFAACDTLTDNAVLPGFRVLVGDVFSA